MTTWRKLDQGEYIEEGDRYVYMYLNPPPILANLDLLVSSYLTANPTSARVPANVGLSKTYYRLYEGSMFIPFAEVTCRTELTERRLDPDL